MEKGEWTEFQEAKTVDDYRAAITKMLCSAQAETLLREHADALAEQLPYRGYGQSYGGWN